MAAPGRQSQCGRTVAPFFSVTLWLLSSAPQIGGDQSQGAVFLREFTLIRRESLNEDFLPDLLNNNHKTEDTLGSMSFNSPIYYTISGELYKLPELQRSKPLLE
ncbi:uncharacterized protein PHA67_007093 isoform 2-T2 [Liasis olivaceus]